MPFPKLLIIPSKHGLEIQLNQGRYNIFFTLRLDCVYAFNFAHRICTQKTSGFSRESAIIEILIETSAAATIRIYSFNLY